MKALCLVLVFIFCSTGTAQGSVGDGINGETFRPQLEYHTKSPAWTPTNKVLFLTAVLSFGVGDTWSTYSAIESGRGTESNPLFGEHPNYATIALSKVAMLGLSWVMVEYMGKPTERQAARNYLYGGLTALGIGVTAWNINVGQ